METKKEIIKGALSKVKLVDAGTKRETSMCGPVEDSSEPRIFYPSLYLNTKEAPMLAGSEVGEDITLLIKAKITSHSVNENSKKKNEDFNLEIKKIGVVSINQ